jgi:hypothetical protein
MTLRAWIGIGVGLALTIGAGVSVTAERLAIRTFTASDGLPRDQVTALLADSRGFLWLGTQEGLARFDGVQFTLFGPAEGLANAAVYDLLEDRAGRYWIATGGGLYRFTPSPREFLRVSRPGAGGATAGASRAAMVLLEDRDGAIWCGSSQGLLRVRAASGDASVSSGLVLDEIPLSLDPTEHGRVVGALLEARDGTLWIGTGSGLFRRARDGRVDRFTRADRLPDDEIWALAQDAAGHLWVGARFGLAQLPPFSRQTVYAGDVAEVVGQSFGMDVTFTQTGIAERAMYVGLDPLWMAGHESAGVTAPSTTWFLAEGATGPSFETFILLANPNDTTAGVTVRFLPDSGVPVVKLVRVPANGRVTMNIEPEDSSLANVAVATDISSTIPIVAERAQYWPDPAPSWYEAHNSFGVTETALKWGLAEGQIGGAAGYQTYVLLANPSANPASVAITFLRENGDPVVKQFTVNPTSRLNVAVRDGGDVPELANERFGAVIQSSIPIAVERALYANVGPQVWGAGTNATATRLPFP